MFDFNDPSLAVQMCKFQGFIQKSHIVIKFPCSYFVEWKTINNRYSICTQKRVRTANDEAIFNEKLTFYTEMVYNTRKKQYYSKETFLVLNLVSKSRPDQVKLVGRVSVDLADVLNNKRFSQMTQMKLNYCSVEGSIVFNILLINKRDSNLSVRDLDRSAFTDYFSINPVTSKDESSSQQRYQSKSKIKYSQHSYDEEYSQLTKQQSSNNNNRLYQNNNNTGLIKVPTFAHVTNNNSQPIQNNPNQKSQNQSNFIKVNQQNHDQELVSFQNSYYQKLQSCHENQIQTGRTQSREQSLIQRLEERNFGSPLVDRWDSQQRSKQKSNNNIVEVGRKQPKNNQNTNEDNLNPKQSPTSIILPKPTSPPSYQWNNSKRTAFQQQKNEYQTQKFLQIVEKLQREKQQQQGMIRQLKAMMVGKSVRRQNNNSNEQINNKVVVMDNRQLQQLHHLQQQNAHLHELQSQNLARLTKLNEQNNNLQQQLSKLRSSLLEKDSLLRQNQRTIGELKQQLLSLNSRQRKYQQEMKSKDQRYQLISNQCKRLQEQYKSMLESMRLSASCQPPSNNNHNKYLLKLNNGYKQNNKNIQQCSLVNSNYEHHFIPQQEQQQQQQSQIKITITKDENIYEDMQKENAQLLERVKELEQENAIYQQLLKQKNQQQQQYHQHQQHNDTSQLLQTMLTSLHQQQPSSQTEMGLMNDAFKITITRDQNIYQEQQEQNKQLYKRVIQLQDQVEKYRQLINQQNELQKPIVYSQQYQSNQYSTTQQNIRRQQKKLTSKLSVQKQDNYQQQGFTIRLTKDNNIFQNQQQEIEQLNKQVQELEQKIREKQKQISKYISVYGVIKQQPDYKISITREQNIYQDQEKEIKQLWTTIDNKDREIVSLVQRISMLEHQIQEVNKLSGNNNSKDDAQIMIRINRQQNIYQQQQNQLNQLSKKVITLQEMIESKDRDIQEKQKVILEKTRLVAKLQGEQLILRNRLKQYQRQLHALQQIVQKNNSKYNTNNNNNNNTTQPSSNCLNCQQLQTRLHQQQQTNCLLQQQKMLLQQQIASLQQQKFNFNSTQNQLKIQIQELNQEVYQLGLENQKLSEELQLLQYNQGLGNCDDGQVQEGEKCQYRESFVERVGQSCVQRGRQEGNITTNNNYNINSNNNNTATLMQQQNTQLKQSLTLFQQQLQQQQLTIGQLQQRISRLMHQKQILIGQNASISNQLTLTKQRLGVVKNEYQKQLNGKQNIYKEKLLALEKQIHEYKRKYNQLQVSVVQQQNKSPHNLQTLLSNSLMQQSLLLKKQQQIQHLQQQLQILNQSLNELSLSYHSLQQTFYSLQKQKQTHMKQLREQKQSQVQHIRQQHEQMNMMLRTQLQQIQQLIQQKQRMCIVNEQKMSVKTSLIQQLSSQLDQLTHELNLLQVENHKIIDESKQFKLRMNNVIDEKKVLSQKVDQLKEEISRLELEKDNILEENHLLQSTIHQLQQSIQTKESSPTQNLTQLKGIITAIQFNNQQRQQQFTLLQSLISSSQTNNQQQSYHNDQALSKLIIRQIQKIKTNILRNHLPSNFMQRSTITSRSTINKVDPKVFAQKTAFLQYLKPLEDLLKTY